MSSPFSQRHIHRGTSVDVEVATAIIATAFSTLPPSPWLVPDPTQRLDVLAGVFRIVVTHALEYGQIDLLLQPAGPDHPATTDVVGPAAGPMLGVAVWFDHSQPSPPPPNYADRLEQAAGEYTTNFEHLDTLFEKNHPDLPHHYLAFLAVVPAAQGTGIGSALLLHHHALLSSLGLPAYLEASSPRSRDLYATQGYRRHGDPFTLPNQAPFFPMLRAPENLGAPE